MLQDYFYSTLHIIHVFEQRIYFRHFYDNRHDDNFLTLIIKNLSLIEALACSQNIMICSELKLFKISTVHSKYKCSMLFYLFLYL